MEPAAASSAPMKRVTVRTIDPLTVGPPLDPSEVDPQTGLPRTFRMYTVCEDPEVLVVPNLLSDMEVEHLIKESQNLWEASFVQLGDNKKAAVHSSRTSYSCTLQPAQTPIIAELEQRLAKVAGMDITHLEQLALVRYQPGQTFSMHHDGVARPKTIFVYLNDLPEDDDGETIFYNLGIQFTPRKGCGVIWPNTTPNGERDDRLMHAGLPPKTGVKYGVNCFFHCRPLKVRGAEGGDDPLGGQVHIKLKAEDEEKGQLATIDPQALLEQDAAQDAAQGQVVLRSYLLSADPKLKIIPNFFSPTEVAGLVAYSEQEDFNLSDETKTLLAEAMRRISQQVGQPVEHNGFSVNKCVEGVMPDGLYMTGDDEYCQRFGQKTMMVFLWEPQDGQGGELRFPRRKIQIRPRSGTAVFWSTRREDGQLDLSVAHQGRAPAFGTGFTVLAVFERLPPLGDSNREKR